MLTMACTTTTTQISISQTLLHSNKNIPLSQHSFLNSLLFTSNLNCNHKNNIHFHSTKQNSSSNNFPLIMKSSLGKSSPSNDDEEEGVSLGTMKLPLDTNIPRFEILLFQWANSLNQGAQLPLPLPMKVDKIEGGVRLGFVEIDDGKTQVQVYIDCQVYSDPPMFRATRKGVLKDKVPPGEPRIMKSLLAALKKSIEIASV